MDRAAGVGRAGGEGVDESQDLANALRVFLPFTRDKLRGQVNLDGRALTPAGAPVSPCGGGAMDG